MLFYVNTVGIISVSLTFHEYYAIAHVYRRAQDDN